MGFHQQLSIDDAIIANVTSERDRLAVALHERVDTIKDYINRIICFDLRIRHNEDIEAIERELAKIASIGDRLAS